MTPPAAGAAAGQPRPRRPRHYDAADRAAEQDPEPPQRRRRRRPRQEEAVIDTPAARGPLPTVRSTPLLLRLVALVGLGLACRAGALVVEHPCCANHLHVPAAFGPDLLSHGPLEGKQLVIVEPEDACSELKPSVDLRGKVALVRRGECNFTEKCLRAQARGAVAVVVYDSQERERWGTIMSGVEERASLVGIPALFVSHATGQSLRDAARSTKGGARVTLNDTGHVRPRAKQIGPVETLATYVVVSLVLLSFSGCCGLLLALGVTCYQRAFRQRAMRGLKLQVYVSKSRKRRGGKASGPVKGVNATTSSTTSTSDSSSKGTPAPSPPTTAAPASSMLSTAVGALADAGSRLWPPRLLLPLLRRARRRGEGGVGGKGWKKAGGASAASSSSSASASASAPEGEEEDDDDDEEEEEALCPICLDCYEDGDRLRVLPCGHHYHDACIRPWLMEKSEACPKCRQPAFHPPLLLLGNHSGGGGNGGQEAGGQAAGGGGRGGGGGGGSILRGLVSGVLGAVAGGGNARGVGERGGAVGVGDGVNNGGGGPAAPLDAAAVDELCIWLLSNLSGIAMVLVAVITSAFLLGAVAILTPKD